MFYGLKWRNKKQISSPQKKKRTKLKEQSMTIYKVQLSQRKDYQQQTESANKFKEQLIVLLE